MRTDELILYAMKAQQWERAKGELRAMVAVKGAVSSTSAGSTGKEPWAQLEEAVEEFITHVEGEGLQE